MNLTLRRVSKSAECEVSFLSCYSRASPQLQNRFETIDILLWLQHRFVASDLPGEGRLMENPARDHIHDQREGGENTARTPRTALPVTSRTEALPCRHVHSSSQLVIGDPRIDCMTVAATGPCARVGRVALYALQTYVSDSSQFSLS